MEMNEVKNWLKDLDSKGFLCRDYKNRIKYSMNKSDLFKIVCDSNGVSYIPDLKKKNVVIPYDILKREFNGYINGKVKPTYDGGYDSCLYMGCLDNSIIIDTTLASLIGYVGEVIIPKNHSARVCLDCDCDVTFIIESNARLRVESYVGTNCSALINIVGDQSRVIIKEI